MRWSVLILIFFISCKKQDLDNPTFKEEYFDGYKVSPNAKNLGKDYWKNIGVAGDLMCYLYTTPIQPGEPPLMTAAMSFGDFNLDGYADIFLPSSRSEITYTTPFSFLIWNVGTKKFEERDLFNDKTLSKNFFGGWPAKMISCYINGDDYVDMVIFDEGSRDQYEPIKLILSDGHGGYNLKEIKTIEDEILFKINNIRIHGGDVGDLNGDGVNDLFISCGFINYIYWGSSEYPYFSKNNRNVYSEDQDNSLHKTLFGYVRCGECSGSYDANFIDIDKDGNKDILLEISENNGLSQQRILVNQGKNKSNREKFLPNNQTEKNNIIYLPFTKSKNALFTDYVIDDIDKNNKLDIIGMSHETKQGWDIKIFTQNTDGTFSGENNLIEFNINNSRSGEPFRNQLIYDDFDKDGQKDLYPQSILVDKNIKPSNEILKKSVFLRKGQKFVENSLYTSNEYFKFLYDNNVIKLNY